MLASKSFARSAAPSVCHRRLRAANVEVQELVTTKSACRQVPLIERLGGPKAVQAAVDVFYGKVLADDRVKHYFDSTDMAKQRAHQAAFMTYAFGGSNKYQGKDLAAAHRHLIPHLTEEHFNAIVDNFVTTLQELGIQQEDIDECVKIVASTKDAVLAE